MDNFEVDRILWKHLRPRWKRRRDGAKMRETIREAAERQRGNPVADKVCSITTEKGSAQWAILREAAALALC